MNNYTAGFARLDITPPLGVRLGGYFTVRIADGVLTQICEEDQVLEVKSYRCKHGHGR